MAVDNVLVAIATEVNQPMFQFISAIEVCLGKHIPFISVRSLFAVFYHDRNKNVWSPISDSQLV